MRRQRQWHKSRRAWNAKLRTAQHAPVAIYTSSSYRDDATAAAAEAPATATATATATAAAAAAGASASAAAATTLSSTGPVAA